MPIYDPAIRPGGGGSVGSTGGTSSASVPKPPNTANNDLIIVCGRVGNIAQINPPDGTWTRINGIIAGFQTFWKRAGGGEPASYVFTWDGSNQAYIFDSLAAYSQTGGTVNLDQAVTSETVGTATQKTSDAVTPAADALVLVTYQEFVIGEPGAPSGPGGLTQVQAVGGVGAPSVWSGYIYVAGSVSSGTFICSNTSFDPGTPWHWSSGTFSLTSVVSSARPPLLTDEALFIPSTRSIPDVVFRSCTGDTAFGIFSGASLQPAVPNGLHVGDLLIAHIWSNGTDPGEFPFLSTPVGWTYQPSSYLNNYFSTPAASWLFYKIATIDDLSVSQYVWVLPRPTLNTWTMVIYDFIHVDPMNIFNGFKTATGGDGSPRAPGLTPDWRNDVSLLLFAEIDPPGLDSPPWPASPPYRNAPTGYELLCSRQNQGDQQVGYLGVPNSCNPVPDIFAYTEMEQIAAMGSVRFRSAWFAYSFLLKNINVTAQTCKLPAPAPPFPPHLPLPAPSFSGLNNQLLLLALNEGGGGHKFSTYSAFSQLGLTVATIREVELPDKSIRVLATASDNNTYWVFGGTQDGSITATLQTQELPTPAQIPRKLWGQKKVFRQMWVDGVDIGNYMVSYSVDRGATFSQAVPLQNFNLIGLEGITIIVKLTHAAATLKTPLFTYMNIDYDVVGLTVGNNA